MVFVVHFKIQNSQNAIFLFEKSSQIIIASNFRSIHSHDERLFDMVDIVFYEEINRLLLLIMLIASEFFQGKKKVVCM